MKPARLISTLAAGALLALAACSQDGAADAPERVNLSPVVEDVVMGDPAAPVKIVEYASITCPHCRDFHKQVLPRLKSAYVDTGKASYVLRDFPTAPAPVAAAGAAIARCTGADGYYAVIDDLFDNQYELLTAAQAGNALGGLIEVGARHDLSEAEVRACIEDPSIREFIIATQRDAPPAVTATPTILIDGVKTESNAYEAIAAAIDARLAAVGLAPTPATPAPAP